MCVVSNADNLQLTQAPHRLMSDYEVNLVNDNMQEFYVRFYGPAESALSLPAAFVDPT